MIRLILMMVTAGRIQETTEGIEIDNEHDGAGSINLYRELMLFNIF